MADNWLDLESARPPPRYGKALQLRSLDVSDNALNCSMSSFYEKFAPLLPSLQSLYLRRCMLWGNVLGDQDRQWAQLVDAGALEMLMLLDLSQNALTGNAFYSEERVAPGLLSNPFLVFCNLSYTHVEVGGPPLPPSRSLFVPTHPHIQTSIHTTYSHHPSCLTP